jgi:uncharacterized protein YjbI with pentapeptide repeats
MKKARFSIRQLEPIVFGVLIGIAMTLVGEALYHELTDQMRLGFWRRAIQNRHVEKVARLLDESVGMADAAIEEGNPLALSTVLATDHLGSMYAHQMRLAENLLRNGEIEQFNQLRQSSPYLLYDLSYRDFSGLDLSGADLSTAALDHIRLNDCDLSNVNFTDTDLSSANLTGAELDGAVLTRAVLVNAILTGVKGKGPDFSNAVLAESSLTQITDLEDAVFDDANFVNANLHGSRFPAARFDGADLTAASAVNADFSQVASLSDSDLTGVNLAGAQFSSINTERLWLINADGLSENARRALERQGGITSDHLALRALDPRIIDGFRVQIDEDESIRPTERRGVLLSMIRDYYQR